jgi:hypothetical protein
MLSMSAYPSADEPASCQMARLQLPLRAGLQALSTLQHLGVLHVPCDDPHAIIRLAVQLPRLRSLDLRTSSSLGLQQDGRQLDVAAAAMLTELRLPVSTKDADLLQRMQMPPRLAGAAIFLLTMPFSAAVYSACTVQRVFSWSYNPTQCP